MNAPRITATTSPDISGVVVHFADGTTRMIDSGTTWMEKSDALRGAGFDMLSMWEGSNDEFRVPIRARAVVDAVWDALRTDSDSEI